MRFYDKIREGLEQGAKERLPEWTVIGYYGNGQIFCEYVRAKDPMRAFLVLSKEGQEREFVAAFPGRLVGTFPGDSVVDSESIRNLFQR